MFSTNWIFGTGKGRVHSICLEHVNDLMLMFVKGYKDFWKDAHDVGDNETFGSYLKDVSPKRILKGKERTQLYNSLITSLESPDEEELTIEQEYMLFHIIDNYIECGVHIVSYNHDPFQAKLNSEEVFEYENVIADRECVYPNIWYIKNSFARSLVINDMRERAKEIFADIGTKVNKKEKDKEIERIFEELMSSVEDISTYRELLDDNDFELYDEIPNIRGM